MNGTCNNHSGLTRRPLPVDEEIAGRVAWLIRLRWIAGAAVVILTCITAAIPQITIPWPWILGGGILILTYNTVFIIILNRLKSSPDTPAQHYSRLASAQFITDWIALTVLVHLTGGMGSPILFFFVFHAILASILLPPRPAFIHATAGVMLVAVLAVLEYSKILPHRPVGGFLSVPADDPLIVGGMLMFFSSAIFMAMYLAGSIANRLWKRTQDLLNAADQLESAYNQTRTLNDIARTVSSSLDLQEVLDRIVAEVIKVMGVHAGSLRLIDPGLGTWWTRAAKGLPDSFLDIQDSISPTQGPFNRQLMAGEVVVATDLAGTEGCLYPEAMRNADLRSLLAVPLQSAGITIGILKIFSREVRTFTPDEITFLSALANQVVAAVENARAYKRLQDLETAKSRFFFMAAHELKSPVAAVQSSMDLLKEGYLGDLPENQLQLVERSYRRLAGLKSLLADLMDMGSMGNRTTRQNEDVDFGSLVSQVSEFLQSDAALKGVTLNTRIKATGTIHANKDHLERLIFNLVGNALKYTATGGQVDVTLTTDENTLLFNVTDSGVGIEPAALPHIFEEFYRAEGTRKSHEGTGLGLALVKRIADLYGAMITVTSTPGEGTSFTTRLPLK